ncbi:MAG: pilus assembly protein, partial [Erythrobacter sp.]
MNRMLRKLWSDTKGNTLAIFAAALVPLVVVIGSGLDLSFAYMAKAKLQNACDAASLAARQSMTGTTWTSANETEARKFFDFNFPDGLMGSQNLSFTIVQDPNDNSQVNGVASADVPTSLMHIFGFDTIAITANCDAKRDLGHNDVMLVLDTTGSMNSAPSIGGDTKIVRLRNGASGLYRALDDSGNGSITRFGIVSYSQTVNVARRLKNRDILKEQLHTDGDYTWYECDTNGRYIWNCTSDDEEYESPSDAPYTGFNGSRTKYAYTRFEYDEDEEVHIDDTQWASAANTTNQNRRDF